jgi:hypothetical protein
MPEPTTAPTWPWADRLRDDIATLKRGDDIELMHNRFELQRLLADHLDVLEQLNKYSAAVAVLTDENDRLGDRAAAAEAAIQRVRDLLDDSELIASAGGQTLAPWVRSELNGPASTLTERPDLSTIAGILAADLHNQPVTVQGSVRRIEVRKNQANAPYLEITLVDDLENTLTVTVPPGVYAHMDAALMPVEADQVRVTGRTDCTIQVRGYDVRTPVGELVDGTSVYDLNDQPLPAAFTKGGAQ